MCSSRPALGFLATTVWSFSFTEGPQDMNSSRPNRGLWFASRSWAYSPQLSRRLCHRQRVSGKFDDWGLVAIAVIAHDFGDGVSTVGVLGSEGWSACLDRLASGGTPSPPVLGCGAALGISISQGLIADVLGFFAGSFLFIGAAHLLPEAEQEGPVSWLYLAVVAGFVSIFLINRYLVI